jgi:hypothetical protein
MTIMIVRPSDVHDRGLIPQQGLKGCHEVHVRLTRLEALCMSGQVAPLDLEQVEIRLVERWRETMAQVAVRIGQQGNDAGESRLELRAVATFDAKDHKLCHH